MKKNLTTKLLFFIFCIGFLATGCKEDNPDPVDNNKNCFVTKVKEGNNTTELEYDANNNITKLKFDSAGSTGYFNLTRNTSNQITKAQLFDENNASDFYLAYEYNGEGLVSKTEYFFKNPQTNNFDPWVYSMHEYNNKRLSKSSLFVKFPGIPFDIPGGYVTYTYDTKGNITKAMKYEYDYSSGSAQAELAGTTEYQYDDKKNPASFFSFLLVEAETLSANNVTSAIEKDENGAVVHSLTNSYEYNQDGYPTKKTTTASGSSTTMINTIEYNCK